MQPVSLNLLGNVRYQNNKINSTKIISFVGNFENESFKKVPQDVALANLGVKFSSKIVRFKQVDENLYRGGKPNLEQLKYLKSLGINTVVDFSTGYSALNVFESEKDLVEGLEIKYVHLPFPSFENPSDEYVETFFETMEEAKENDEKVYIHCTHGKDRTGLFSAMYKLNYGLDDLDGCIDEMYAMGHDDVLNPNLVPYLREFAKKLG